METVCVCEGGGGVGREEADEIYGLEGPQIRLEGRLKAVPVGPNQRAKKKKRRRRRER